MEWEMVAGLEIHARIKSKSKMFCGCDNDTFAKEPNTHICPVCSGFPGALPAVNRRALELGALTGMALHCEIPDFSQFDRKSYFYPDLPSGFQITQMDHPVAINGFVEFFVKKEKHTVRINRLHLENDAGKLTHENDHSLVDFNRAGSPLMEMVTEADFRSPEQIVAFLKELQKILRTVDSSFADMEKGMMRCDVNISLRPKGQKEFGTKSEIKNMNSFGNIEKAVRFEYKRHKTLLEKGKKVQQETRGWDAEKGVSLSQRSKEEAADYRYFPEPDLPPTIFTTEEKEALRAQLPELPAAKMTRFLEQYKLPWDLAEILAGEKALSVYFETAAALASPKKVANWICGDLLGALNEENKSIADALLTAENMGQLVKMIDERRINGKIAKDIFPELLKTGVSPEKLVKEKGLAQNSNTDEVKKICAQVLEENPQMVTDFLGGKERVLGALVGQVMKSSRGQANPQMANELLKTLLKTMA